MDKITVLMNPFLMSRVQNGLIIICLIVLLIIIFSVIVTHNVLKKQRSEMSAENDADNNGEVFNSDPAD